MKEEGSEEERCVMCVAEVWQAEGRRKIRELRHMSSEATDNHTRVAKHTLQNILSSRHTPQKQEVRRKEMELENRWNTCTTLCERGS